MSEIGCHSIPHRFSHKFGRSMSLAQPLPLFLAPLILLFSPVHSDLSPTYRLAYTSGVQPAQTADAGIESQMFFLIAIAVCVIVFGGVIAFGAIIVRRGGCQHPSSEQSFSDVADEPGGQTAQPAQAEPSQAAPEENPTAGFIFLPLV
jgi:hypothetical protein